MLSCQTVRLLSSPGLSRSLCPPARPSSHRPSSSSLRCSPLPDDKEKRRKDVQNKTIIHIAGDVIVNSGEATAKLQPVGWDAVAISPEAKALLQQHAVKASTALKMHRILGFEDVDDVQRLTPDLIAQLKLQPLQLDPLLTMLQQPQPGADGLHQAHKQQPATALKPLVHSGLYYRAISPDGRTALATNARNKHKLEAWDLATGARVAVMGGHEERIWSVAITPDGSKAVSGCMEMTLRVWDLATYRCSATLKGHTGWVTAVAVARSGSTAVSGSADDTLRLWDLSTCTCTATLEGHTACVRSVAISPDGRTVVSGSIDKTLRLWDLATRRCTATLEGHTAGVQSVAISPDGRTAVSGSQDKTVRVWDLASNRCTATLEGHTHWVTCLALTPDGRHAVSGSADFTLRLWDLAMRTCIATMAGEKGHIYSVLITPNGRYAVSNVYDSTPRVWDLAPYLGTPSAAAVQR